MPPGKTNPQEPFVGSFVLVKWVAIILSVAGGSGESQGPAVERVSA